MINVQAKSLQITSKNNEPQRDASSKNVLPNRDEGNSFKTKLAQKLERKELKDITKAPREDKEPLQTTRGNTTLQNDGSLEKACDNSNEENSSKSKLPEKVEGQDLNVNAEDYKDKKAYEENDNAQIIMMALMKLMQETNDIEKLKGTGDLPNDEYLSKIKGLDGKTVEDLVQKLIRVLNKTQDDSPNDSKIKKEETSVLKDLTALQSSEKAFNLSDINKILEFLKSKAETPDNNLNISDDKGLGIEISKIIDILNKNVKEDKNGEKPNELITVNKDNSPKDKVVPLAVVKDITTVGKKDESFLKSLIDEVDKKDTNSKIDSKINRAMNIMSTLSNVDKTVEVGENTNLVVNKASVSADVVKVVKYMEINNLKNLTVKVAPKELGEIVIKLTMEAGKMKLSLNAATKETFNLLNASVQELSSKLTSGNIKVHPTEINIYNEDTTFFSNQFNDGQASNHGSEGKTSGSGRNERDSNLLEEDENISENEIYDESSVNALA